jgi:hypothetical protein
MNAAEPVLYEHTQPGTLVRGVLTASIVLVLALMGLTSAHWIAVGVLILLVVFAILFHSLTVRVTERRVEVRFGPGLIGKRFAVETIEDSAVVRNRWYYGWGVRLTPHGWLYNVSGLSAVEIRLTDGRKVRIGTDEPHELRRAIEEACR